jgi:predicted O-methyltransferase YrrM
MDEVRRDEKRLFEKARRELPALDLNESAQLDLLGLLAPYYGEIPFRPDKVEGLRYYYANPTFSYSDAILLYCMIRHLKPKRIIEVGSGYSSCVILDTNELHFDNAIKTTFIEPYPKLLLSLLKEGDVQRIRLLPHRLQDVKASEFDAVGANDILFIDSSHVSKIGSDVNRVFFEILPSLSSGVYIHFHDILYPFEYPKEWIYDGRAWNESYLLRAFLEYNSKFRIAVWSHFMERFHRQFYKERMPLCLRVPGGSIWIRKE